MHLVNGVRAHALVPRVVCQAPLVDVHNYSHPVSFDKLDKVYYRN